MVDLVSKATNGDGAVTRVAAPTPVAAVTPVAGPVVTRTTASIADTAQTSGLAAALAASPPVESDRVATIKRAIADGRFPILPATIADRLIALKLQWKPYDPEHD